ncbi:MAG: hypothetical protein LUG83_00575 [Lachnospiraceae bacterium]|nr:hypothetical protein [Lachnospiraceae bacterium]
MPPIDSGYQGEIYAIISNVSNDAYEIKFGDKIGQLVILPVVIPEFTYEAWKERGTEHLDPQEGRRGKYKKKEMTIRLDVSIIIIRL